MQPHSIVVVSLHTPKEKVWGQLIEITTAGVTMRGVDLSSFDEVVRQIVHPEGERIGLPTLFFPLLRVERIALDESHGSIPSLADIFNRKVGRTVADYIAQFS
ncbi:MAG: hypothetical protein WA755_08015 [Candidatus Acidiferrales bacterium]